MEENTHVVTIPLDHFIELVRKAEQRDVILRFAEQEKYSVNKKELFNLCGETLPTDVEEE